MLPECATKHEKDKQQLLERMYFPCVFISIYRLLHRKCDVQIFIHELQNFGKLTRSVRSLVRFPQFLQRVNKDPYKALSML